ncbi:MAG TPA: DAK2 domain-containing protein [Acidimicrobiales bacterium]|nr:DAK2 domain-containing protein [Acidimicrobiales bacterium]
MTRTALCFDQVDEFIRTYRDVLATHREAINRLNVYPVPDGDTGTNMGLTLESVVQEIPADCTEMGCLCRAIAHGSLMGARGNSGVILSQILRGLADTFASAEGGRIDGALMVEALETAAEAAYQAVMKPVEGTILTVARRGAEEARRAFDSGRTALPEVVEAARDGAAEALEHTPELLPVLAEAGVVDAGGAGFLLLLDAALHVVDGRELPPPPTDGGARPTDFDAATMGHGEGDVSDLRYEVMYFLEAPDEAVPAFKDVWVGIGDSIVVVGGDGLWNCHIHTNDIGAAIEAAIDIGRPRNIRVTDLAEEVEEERWVREAAAGTPDDSEPRARVGCAVVAVSPAEGTGRIFHSLGVQELVSGGQTMNPSTADLLAAVERAPADAVVILPNNKNIVPVARQVAEHSDKSVAVVETTSVPEGFASLLAYDPEASAAENAAEMAEISADVKVGEVTRAVRDTTCEAGPISEGDWLGIDRGGIRVVNSSMTEAAIRLLDHLIDDDSEILTIIEGAEATTGDTRTITEWAASHRPDLEVEVHDGGQPHYPYFFGVE